MKKLVYYFICLIGVLIIIIVVKTLIFKSLQVYTEPVILPFAGDKAIKHLSKAISFPTVSYSADSPIDTAAFKGYLDFINETYPLVNSRLDKEIFNDFSLLYRWRGANVSLKPMILMAHFDVVPPGDSTLWEKEPFSGEYDGNFIWGRGALDDKASMISILEAVEKLLSEGFEPVRTIYLSFGHDEEIGGSRGAGAISSEMVNRGVQPEFILDEGMAITIRMIPMISKPVALIGISEKGYMSVKLSVNMQGGHSSTPEKESAITVLSRAVVNLSEKQMKPMISGPVDDFIKYVGPEMPFYAKIIFANKWIFKTLLLRIYSRSISGNALVRTTTAPTIFQAGVKDNMIPVKAEAVINFRILPGETSADVMNHITKIVDDERVKTEIMEGFLDEPAPVSPSDVFGYITILKTIRQIYSDVVVAPTLMLASSDSRHFLKVSENVYRFAPIVITNNDIERIHGLNERINAHDLNKATCFYFQLIKNSN